MDKLIEAMKKVNDLNKSHGVTQRGGKKYTEVSTRIEAFRMAFGVELGIDSDVVVDDGKRVVVKAIITDSSNRILGSGMAEEIRGSSNVNKTSALENCETSAIGRALASLGLHGGTYASANEMAAVVRKEQAQRQQAAAPEPERDAMGLPPVEDAHEYRIHNHEGKPVKGPHHDFDAAVKDLVALLKIYAKTERNKAGDDVTPRERMTLVRQVREANDHILADMSEGGLERFDAIYRKVLAHLGAQQVEAGDAADQ